MKILFIADEESKIYWDFLRRSNLRGLTLLYPVET